MRSAILSYIQTLSLGTFAVTEELPWDNNGTPLYMSNLKRIYVDAAQSSQDPAFDVFNGGGSVNEITTVRVVFVTDAKQLPSNYESLVDLIKLARLESSTAGYIQRLCQVTTEFTGDKMTTEFEFSFRKTLTN
jgi:hypothetical protein